jgi:uncharacterized protein YbjT (DUF2867 family)
MILVSGATGNVGGELVRQLVGAGVPVRALTRDASRASFPEGVEVAEGDLSRPETLPAAFKAVDALFLIQCGTEEEVLRIAKEAGVRRVVLLSALASQTRPASAIGHDHLQAEHAVRDSGLSWTSVRPGQFASNALNWAGQIRAAGAVRAPFAQVGLPAIHPADIAAVARVALTADGHDGKVYPLTGPAVVTPPEQVRAIGDALGRELVYQEVTAEQARERMIQHSPVEIVDSALALIGSPTPEEQQVLSTVEDVTGAPARSFAQWARDNVAAFR